MNKNGSKTVRIGFIALGEHQIRAHVVPLDQLSKEGCGIELVGYYDLNPDAATKALEHLPAGTSLPAMKSYASDVELLNDPEIDAVFIASPDKDHTRQLALAVAAGKHAFCEKPITVTLEDVATMNRVLEAAERAGLTVTTCHPRRFDPPFIWLRNQLPALSGRLGELVHFDFSFFYHEVTDPWKKERSLLSDHFGHEIDILDFVAPPAQLTATKLSDSYRFYEVNGSTFDLDGKPRYSYRFMGSRNLPESVYKEMVRLDFEKGAVLMNVNQGIGWELPDGTPFEFPKMCYETRFLATNRNFIEAVQGKSKNYLRAEDLMRNNSVSVSLTEHDTATWCAAR